MLSEICVLTVLLGAVSVSANDIPIPITKTNGISASLANNAISIFRVLPPATTVPPATTPASTLPPSSSPANVSNSSVMPTQPMNSQTPPPSTVAPALAPVLTTGRINISSVSIRELNGNFTQVSNSTSAMPVSGNPMMTATTSIPGSNPAVQLNCQSLNFESSSLGGASMAVYVCAILNNGSVAYGGEVNQVAMGQLSVSALISDWPWTSTGSYLEFKFTMSVQSGRQMSVTSGTSAAPVMIGLGTTDSYGMFSTKTTNSDYSAFQTMPVGYPSLTKNNLVDNMASVTAMFPRFTSVSIWNAVIEPGYQPSQTPPGSVSAADGIAVSWLIQAVVAVLACLVGSFDRRQ